MLLVLVELASVTVLELSVASVELALVTMLELSVASVLSSAACTADTVAWSEACAVDS